jgi:putative oxidoreductase
MGNRRLSYRKIKFIILKKFFQNKIVLFILRLIIGGLFIYAAVPKITDPKAFAAIVKGYQLFPIWSVNLIAIVLPYVELLTGLFLILGFWKKANAAIIGTLLFFFIIGLVQAYARGLEINCGCFSTSAASTPSDIIWRIVQDIFMLIATIIIFIFSGRETIKTDSLKNSATAVPDGKINNGGNKNE